MPPLSNTLIWLVVAFISGSLPFSMMLGQLLLRADIRDYGDGNPGSTNAWRAGGWKVGLPALVLDFLKGAVPVALAQSSAGIAGIGLAAVALAPVLGHCFSPFLWLHGGKGIAVTFGVWTGLLPPAAPLLLGLAMAGLLLLGRAFPPGSRLRLSNARAALLGMLPLLGYLLLRAPEPALLAAWAGNFALLLWTHRHDLTGVSRGLKDNGESA